MKLDMVVPVYNEEHRIEQGVRRLHAFLSLLPLPTTSLAPSGEGTGEGFSPREASSTTPSPKTAPKQGSWQIIILNNGSTDNTAILGRALALKLPNVSYFSIPERGRGHALRYAWSKSQADVVGYTDVDLATDISYLPYLLLAIQRGADFAIASRYKDGARVKRERFRLALSWSYNFLLRQGFHPTFHDAQCGLKVMRTSETQNLLPMVKDNGWFFDTELLLLAARSGYRIVEVPVRWQEKPGSKVKVISTAAKQLYGLGRLRVAFWGKGLGYASK